MMGAIIKAKPAAIRGRYIKCCVVPDLALCNYRLKAARDLTGWEVLPACEKVPVRSIISCIYSF